MKIHIEKNNLFILMLKKVIIHPQSKRIVFFFSHSRSPSTSLFNASITFCPNRRPLFAVFEGAGPASVSEDARDELKSLLLKSFSHYFDFSKTQRRFPWQA